MRCFTLALFSVLSVSTKAQTINWKSALPQGKLVTKLILEDDILLAQGPGYIERINVHSGDITDNTDSDSQSPERSRNEVTMTVSKNNKVMYMPTKKGIYMYEMETMTLIDVFMEDMDSVVLLDDSIFCMKDGKLMKFNLEEHSFPEWTNEKVGGKKIVEIQRLNDNELLVQLTFGFVKIQDATGAVEWKYAPRNPMHTNLVTKNSIYTAEDYGYDVGSVITQVSLNSGKRMWEFPIVEVVIGDMLIQDNNLYFMTVQDDHHTEVYSMDTTNSMLHGSIRGVQAKMA